MHIMQSRRDFLSTLSAAGAAGVFGARTPRAGEAPPETSTVLIGGDPPGICIAPQYIAEDLLRAEGFTEIRYLSAPGSVPLLEMIGNGEVNFGIVFVLNSIVEMEAGKPLTLLAGIHSGCFELFAHDRIGSIKDLKGRSVVVIRIPGGQGHSLISVRRRARGAAGFTTCAIIRRCCGRRSSGRWKPSFCNAMLDEPIDWIACSSLRT
jgi:NitT/TauT family transport system substrate-binding protein